MRISTALRPMRIFVRRLCALMVPMLLAVASLSVVEAIVLWLAGFTYTSQSYVSDIGILDFRLIGERNLGISRVFFRQSQLSQSCGWEVLVHDMRHADHVRRLYAHQLDPQVVSAAPDGCGLAIGSITGVIHVWDDLEAHSPARELPEARGESLTALGHSPDGKWLFAASHSALYGWQLKSGQLIHRFRHQSGSKCSIAFNHHSTKVMSVGWDSHVRVFDIECGVPLDEMPLPSPGVFSATLSPDGNRVAAATIAGMVAVVDLPRQTVLWQTKVGDAAPITFSNDGERVAVVNEAGHRNFKIQIRAASTGHLIHQFLAHESLISGLVFAPDNTLISWDLEGHIRKWDLQAQKITWKFSALDWSSVSQVFANQRRDSGRGDRAGMPGFKPAAAPSAIAVRISSGTYDCPPGSVSNAAGVQPSSLAFQCQEPKRTGRSQPRSGVGSTRCEARPGISYAATRLATLCLPLSRH